MHEVESKTKYQMHNELVGALNAINQTLLANTALLMRLYDVNSALLHHFDAGTTDDLFDRHAEGGHLNPPIFIPEIKESGDE